MQSLGDNRLASFSHDIACVSFQLKTSSLVIFAMTLEIHTMWTVGGDILVWRELWNLFYTQGRLWSLGELTAKLSSKARREVFSHKVIWNERSWGSCRIFLVCLLGDVGQAASPLSLNMWTTVLCVFRKRF